ncbi:hypothetical protein AC790_17345 [Pantoea sp. RIT-PI-b]|uniref:hypothetical protein n=1 Tax=Pantoea sp. RIT-PI-b TaxID=1681195 RepID=UPI0006766C30|nr:hypothetical protein [Pantoea sp. RIT-PI-b]KNC08351.1 hypothetical protein AC790_17345 [Pantoea sp. RIT-PI-b]
MKIKIAVVGASVLLTATVAFAGMAYSNDKPDYVIKAENSTNNFLMYSYGPGKCTASKGSAHQWEMECSYDGGEDLVKYSVLPSNEQRHGKSGKFRLVAQNQLAAESATRGLTRYLNITTDKI